MAISRVLCATSTSWLVTAELPRLLHRAGAHVTVLGPPDAWPLRGSFVDAWVPARGGAREVAGVLGAHLRAGAGYDWIILGDDPLLASVGARSVEPWAPAALPVPPHPPHLGLLGSKTGFVRAAHALGLPIPFSRVCEGRDQARAALLAWGGPVILKREGPSGGQGCHMVESDAALDALPAGLFRAPVVVQAFLDGPALAIEAIDDSGRLVHAVTSRVVLSWPDRFGASAIRRFADEPGLVALAAEIGARAAPHGFANITAVPDPAGGGPRLIELDLRPNALFHLGEALGADAAGALRALLARRPPAPPSRLPAGLDVEVPIYPGNLLRCLVERDGRGLAAWALDLDGRRRWMPRGDRRLRRALAVHVARQLARHTVDGVRARATGAARRGGAS